MAGDVLVESPDDGGVLLDGHADDGADDGEDHSKAGDGGALPKLWGVDDDTPLRIGELLCLVFDVMLPTVIFFNLEQLLYRNSHDPSPLMLG